MPISGPWSELTLVHLDAVPAVPGVFEIGTLVRNTLYIGRSAGRDLRSCLKSQLLDPQSQIRHRALYFRYEGTPRDEQRHATLLEEYARSHAGKLPPLNQSLNLERSRMVAARPLRVVEQPSLRAAS